MHDPWHKMVPPGAGFVGAILMMTFLGEMSRREWLVAVIAGIALPYFGTDIAMHYLEFTLPWLGSGVEHNMSLAGLIGFVLGLMGIHIIGAMATIGRRFSSNPVDFRGVGK